MQEAAPSYDDASTVAMSHNIVELEKITSSNWMIIFLLSLVHLLMTRTLITVTTLFIYVVATKLGIIGANEVRARADVVATKLGIILLSFSSFFLSMHLLFSQKGFA